MKCISLNRQQTPELPKGALLALGCFDGLHIGHRALLEEARDMARTLGVPYGVWSPVGAKNAPRLMAEEERQRMLRDLGVDFLLEENFSELKDVSAEDFFREFLLRRYQVSGLACGENFTFGRERRGDSRLLRDFCAGAGIPLLVKKTVFSGGEAVSSAAIRHALLHGELLRASEFSGHFCGFFSTVQQGRQVGRVLGMPTLNLPLPEKGLWAEGVYLAAVLLPSGEKIPAVANIGVHPTFERAEEPLCEAHLLNPPPKKALYGERVYIEFYRYLRPEKKFGDAEELKKQLEKDLSAAKNFFAQQEG